MIAVIWNTGARNYCFCAVAGLASAPEQFGDEVSRNFVCRVVGNECNTGWLPAALCVPGEAAGAP